MIWLKSTTQKSYMFSGKTVPQAVTPDNDYLALNDSEFIEWKKTPVFASLLNNGAIFVTDKEPTSPTKQLSNLTSKNAELVLENSQLREELKKVQSAVGDNSEVNSLKAALEKQRADDLAEITSLRDAKDKEIAELRAQLAELRAQLAELQGSEE